MHQVRLLSCAIILLGIFLDVRPAGAGNNVSLTQPIGVSVEDFGYLDT